MLSSRLRWDLPPNPLTGLLRSKRAVGALILDLTESNPTQADLVYPDQEILRAFADPGALRYEPSPAGLLSAREAIAESYYAPLGIKVDPDRILLTASTSEAYSYVMKLLADPGDELLVPRPSYPLFDFLAALDSVRVVQYPLLYDEGWSIDFAALETAVTERSRAIAVVNPNNPTGSFLKRWELDRLVALCEKHNLAILSDEVFSDYGFASNPERVEHLIEIQPAPAFCMSGLSKIAGLPQMKLGWIVANRSMEELELVADTYLSVAAPVQHAARELLRLGAGIRRQIQRRTRRNLDVLRGLIAGTVGRILAVEGGWYATVQTPLIRTAEEWALELLDQAGVLVQPGYFYDFEREGFLVLSLLTPEASFREGVTRLIAHIEKSVR